jgi:hypothetical protein
VKQGSCRLNQAWTNPEGNNIQRVLQAIGALPLDHIDEVALSLYEQGFFRNGSLYISLFCIGNIIDGEVQGKYPCVPQVTWENALRFIFHRFKNYRRQKGEHEQWDESGHVLWKCAAFSTTEEEFITNIKILWMIL